MNIAIVGTGYVGLITGLCFAKFNNRIVFCDIDKEKLRKLEKGKLSIFEPGLEKLFNEVKARISFTDDLKSTILETEISFICVGTPAKEDSSINIDAVKKVAEGIGLSLKEKTKFHVVVIKSTVVPETSKNIVLPIIEKNSGKKAGEFGLCMNPEFLREGNAVDDFLNPDRIIIGGNGKKEIDILSEFYRNMFKAEIIRTNLATAETIKYASNSLLALLISFSNEFANISETINNVDVDTVLKAVCLDKRISPLLDKKRISPEIVSYLRAGCGFGGSCFPKDLKGIIHFAKSKNYDPKMLESIISINNAQMSHLVERLKKQMNLDGKRIAVLGLSFKPDTDDIRESPSIRLINNLLDENANVIAHDPVAMENTKILFKNRISFASSKLDALKDSDACFVVTAWDEYKKIDESDFKRLMKNPIVIDCRRLYKVEKMKNIKYIGTGLG